MPDLSHDVSILRETVESWLGPREQVLWVGQPRKGRFRGEMFAEVILGLVACGAAALATFMIVVGFIQSRDPALLCVLLAPAIFVAAGWHYLGAPRRYRRLLANVVYAVTTERAILVEGFGYAIEANLCELDDPDRCFDREAVRRRELKRARRNGSGDIIFDEEWRVGRRRRKYRVEIGFFGVNNVEKVDAFLDLIARPKSPKAHDEPELA